MARRRRNPADPPDARPGWNKAWWGAARWWALTTGDRTESLDRILVAYDELSGTRGARTPNGVAWARADRLRGGRAQAAVNHLVSLASRLELPFAPPRRAALTPAVLRFVAARVDPVLEALWGRAADPEDLFALAGDVAPDAPLGAMLAAVLRAELAGLHAEVSGAERRQFAAVLDALVAGRPLPRDAQDDAQDVAYRLEECGSELAVQAARGVAEAVAGLAAGDVFWTLEALRATHDRASLARMAATGRALFPPPSLLAWLAAQIK